jgi:cysteinyl-tRNA synthetase
MAELGPGPHRSGDVARKIGRRVDSLGPVRSKIIAKGMAYAPDYGDIAFTVPKFDEYLRRAMPAFERRALKKRLSVRAKKKTRAVTPETPPRRRRRCG